MRSGKRSSAIFRVTRLHFYKTLSCTFQTFSKRFQIKDHRSYNDKLVYFINNSSIFLSTSLAYTFSSYLSLFHLHSSSISFNFRFLYLISLSYLFRLLFPSLIATFLHTFPLLSSLYVLLPTSIDFPFLFLFYTLHSLSTQFSSLIPIFSLPISLPSPLHFIFLLSILFRSPTSILLSFNTTSFFYRFSFFPSVLFLFSSPHLISGLYLFTPSYSVSLFYLSFLFCLNSISFLSLIVFLLYFTSNLFS